jgi:3-hydroxyacyl-[acyl-carrier-protein] dehydratase
MDPESITVYRPPLEFAAPLPAVDAVRVTRAGDTYTLEATKLVDGNDRYLAAHFPGQTVFPGVFLIEAVRQAVALGLPDEVGQAPDVELVRSVRFLSPLLARDYFFLTAEVTRGSAPGAVDVVASCRRGAVAVATLSMTLMRRPHDG